MLAPGKTALDMNERVESMNALGLSVSLVHKGNGSVAYPRTPALHSLVIERPGASLEGRRLALHVI